MPVKLTNALPKSAEVNGLDHFTTLLTQDPHAFHAAVVFFDCQKVIDETDSATRTPVARIRRVELIHGDDEDPLRKIARRAYLNRTGAEELPLDFDDEVAETFEGR